MRRYYPGITLFKLLGSITVVIYHAQLLNFLVVKKLDNAEMNSFLGVVVPCFYMIAGFLACRGWSNAESPYKYIRKYLKWLILIYGAICMIYIVTDVIPAFFNHKNTDTIVTQAKHLFSKIFIYGPYPSLWFIPPLIFGIIASYYFSIRKKVLIAAIIALLGFIFAQFVFGSLRIVTETLIGDSFYHPKYMSIVMLQLIITTYFGYGFIFVLAGVIIAKYEDIFIQINAGRFILTAIIFNFSEYLFLHYLVKKDYDYQLVFSLLINSILLFYGILHIKWNRLKTHHNDINLFTIVVYFSHMMLIYINVYTLNWQFMSLTEFQSAILVLLALFEGLLLTILIIFLKKHIKGLSSQKLLSKA